MIVRGDSTDEVEMFPAMRSGSFAALAAVRETSGNAIQYLRRLSRQVIVRLYPEIFSKLHGLAFAGF